MKLPGIEYGAVQSLGRDQMVTDYQGNAAAKIAGINKIIDASGNLVLAAEERMNNAQTQKAITHWALRSKEIELDLESQERFNVGYLRDQGMDIQGDDEDELPGYQVRPELMDRMMEQALVESANKIFSPDARERFLNRERPELEAYKKRYILEQFKLGTADMKHQLAYDIQQLMNAGKHAHALKLVELSVGLKEDERRGFKADIENDKDVSDVNFIKNNPVATVADLRALRARVHGRDYKHLTPDQRNRLIYEINDRIVKLEGEQKANRDYEEAIALVDRIYTEDGDPVAMDDALRKHAKNKEQLAIAQSDIANRKRITSETKQRRLLDAWNQLYASGEDVDPEALIKGFDVDEVEKQRMREVKRKMNEKQLVDVDDVAYPLKQLAHGKKEIEIRGRMLKAEDFVDMNLSEWRPFLSEDTAKYLENMQLKKITKGATYTPAKTADFEDRKLAHFEDMFGDENTWTRKEKMFIYNTGLIMDNEMKRMEKFHNRNLEAHEMEKIIRDMLRERYYHYTTITGGVGRKKMSWKDLQKRGVLGDIIRAMIKSGQYRIDEITHEDVLNEYYKRKNWTFKPAFEREAAE